MYYPSGVIFVKIFRRINWILAKSSSSLLTSNFGSPSTKVNVLRLTIKEIQEYANEMILI